MAAVERLYIREGTNTQIQFTLYANDIVINLSTANYVSLVLKDAKGSVQRFDSNATPTAQVAVLIAASGSVGYTPAATDLVASRSPYRGYWWVYDVTGLLKYSAPNENEFEFIVLEDY